MNIKNIHVSSEAENDLDDGRNFYNSQQQGIGEYFWDTFLITTLRVVMNTVSGIT